MNCHYPPYMNYFYLGKKSNTQCSDYSDQIFTEGTRCEINENIQVYKQIFCNETNTDVVRGKLCDEVSNPADWISKQREKLKDKGLDDWDKKEIEVILDPHKCQDSCSRPEYGCEACTNPSYFTCNVNSKPHCLHPKLVCDGHPQCDQAEDEEFHKCRDIKYREEATVVCGSAMYPSKFLCKYQTNV